MLSIQIIYRALTAELDDRSVSCVFLGIVRSRVPELDDIVTGGCHDKCNGLLVRGTAFFLSDEIGSDKGTT